MVSVLERVDCICIREPSVCDVISIRKREDPGNENLGMSVCVWRPLLVSRVGELFRLVFSWRSIYKVGKSRLPF